MELNAYHDHRAHQIHYIIEFCHILYWIGLYDEHDGHDDALHFIRIIKLAWCYLLF